MTKMVWEGDTRQEGSADADVITALVLLSLSGLRCSHQSVKQKRERLSASPCYVPPVSQDTRQPLEQNEKLTDKNPTLQAPRTALGREIEFPADASAVCGASTPVCCQLRKRNTGLPVNMQIAGNRPFSHMNFPLTGRCVIYTRSD